MMPLEKKSMRRAASLAEEVQEIQATLDQVRRSHFPFRDFNGMNKAIEEFNQILKRLEVIGANESAPGLQALRMQMAELGQRLDHHFDKLQPPRLACANWAEFLAQQNLFVQREFSQEELFPEDPNVCNALSDVFFALRAQDMRVADILKILSDPEIKPVIKSLNKGEHVRDSLFAMGTHLRQSRLFQKAHAYCQSRWKVEGNCPGLLAVGCFPENFQSVVDCGRREFAIRLPQGKSMRMRALPRQPVMRGVPRKLYDMLFFNCGEEETTLPLFKIQIVFAYQNRAKNAQHSIVIDLSEKVTGVFDPNLGWLPFERGWNECFEKTIATIGAYYGAAGMIAYQYTRLPKRCLCRYP